MKSLLLICLFSVSFGAFAQQGDVQIHKDKRIDALVAKEGAIEPPAVKPQIKGYRIQLFFDSDKSKVNDARGRFISQFPTVDTYVEYNAPNFFLKVGDFRTRLEAEKIKAEVEAEFPTSFIIQEDIYLPRLVKDLDQFSSRMNNSFGKAYKLTNPGLIDKLFETGETVKEFPFVVKFLTTDLSQNKPFQVAFAIPKKKHRSAVVRNLIRRRIKEALRLNKAELEEQLTTKGKQLAIFVIYTGNEVPPYSLINKKVNKVVTKLIKHI